MKSCLRSMRGQEGKESSPPLLCCRTIYHIFGTCLSEHSMLKHISLRMGISYQPQNHPDQQKNEEQDRITAISGSVLHINTHTHYTRASLFKYQKLNTANKCYKQIKLFTIFYQLSMILMIL